MNEEHEGQSLDSSSEIEELLAVDPNASAMYAVAELQAGRLEWLAEHTRRCDYHIDPRVARKLLELVDGSHPEFELQTVRSKNLKPRSKLRVEQDVQDFELALKVARNGGFKRAHLARVCADVGAEQKPKLSGVTVQRRVRRWRDFALAALG